MFDWPVASRRLQRPRAGSTSLPGRARLSGFTTPELLVTLMILGTLAALATPSMTAAMRRTQIASASNDLLGAISRARTEAQRAGAGLPFTVCPSSQVATPGTAACTASGWTDGIIVFADGNGNGTRESGEQLVLAVPPMGGGVTVSMKSTLPYVLFAPNGMLHGGETGVRFTVSHARAPFQADVQHLCVLRSGIQVVSDASLQGDARNGTCKAL